jgi:hypothetical protein
MMPLASIGTLAFIGHKLRTISSSSTIYDPRICFVPGNVCIAGVEG